MILNWKDWKQHPYGVVPGVLVIESIFLLICGDADFTRAIHQSCKEFATDLQFIVSKSRGIESTSLTVFSIEIFICLRYTYHYFIWNVGKHKPIFRRFAIRRGYKVCCLSIEGYTGQLYNYRYTVMKAANGVYQGRTVLNSFS